MQDDNCIFCRIVRGEIPCAKVYDDNIVMAFLDLGPTNPGHTLVIPKAHYANLLETPDHVAPALFKVCKAVGRALMDMDSGAEGFNVMQNNFPAAGQTVFHAHWHIIPRYGDDGLVMWRQGSYVDNNAMQTMAEKIAAKVVY